MQVSLKRLKSIWDNSDATARLGNKFEEGGCSALDVSPPRCLWGILEL